MQSPNPSPTDSAPQVDPFAPDAPIIHLLSLRHNPLLATATDEQLRQVFERCKAMVQQPQTLQAELRKESAPRGKAGKLKSILDSI